MDGIFVRVAWLFLVDSGAAVYFFLFFYSFLAAGASGSDRVCRSKVRFVWHWDLGGLFV